MNYIINCISNYTLTNATPHPPPTHQQYYAPAGACSLNIFLITWTLVLFLGYAALSVSPWRPPSAGLMTAAACFAYCVYYTWSALDRWVLGWAVVVVGGVWGGRRELGWVDVDGVA